MSGSLLLTVGAGSLGFAIVLMGLAVFARKAEPRGVASGISVIERHYGQHTSRTAGQRTAGTPLELPGWARALAVRLSPSSAAATLQRRLDLAGNPAGWTADRILALKGLGLLGGIVVGVLYGLHNPGLAILAAAVCGGVGFFLPDLLLYNMGTKRQARILTALPDAIDMLTVCVEAGLAFDSGIAQVARNTSSALAEEFARTLQEMQIGRSRSDALRGMVARTAVPDLKAFVSAVIQAGELGIPVARVLREQASEMRIKRRQRAEEKAQKVPVKIMIPLICCIFPALIVVIIGPGFLQIVHSLFGFGG